MSLTKAKIYNLALGALLLQRRTTDPDTDTSNEVRVLNTHWEVALDKTLADLDLDATSKVATLALIEANPNDEWLYAYTYPTDCVLFRRVRPASSSVGADAPDTKSTAIPKRIRIHEGSKAILTQEPTATCEYITNAVTISSLTSAAGMAIAFRLALMSAPLIVGKGAKSLLDSIKEDYIVAKAEAQEIDRIENFNYNADFIDSEFVDVRTS